MPQLWGLQEAQGAGSTQVILQPGPPSFRCREPPRVPGEQRGVEFRGAEAGNWPRALFSSRWRRCFASSTPQAPSPQPSPQPSPVLGRLGLGAGMGAGQALSLEGGKWGVLGRCSSPFAGDKRTDGPQPAAQGDTGTAEHLVGDGSLAEGRDGLTWGRVSPGAYGMGKGTERVTSRGTPAPPQCHWLLPFGPTAVPLCASVSPDRQLRYRPPQCPDFQSHRGGLALRVYMHACAHSCGHETPFNTSPPRPQFPCKQEVRCWLGTLQLKGILINTLLIINNRLIAVAVC